MVSIFECLWLVLFFKNCVQLSFLPSLNNESFEIIRFSDNWELSAICFNSKCFIKNHLELYYIHFSFLTVCASVLSCFNCVWFFAILWTVSCQDPLLCLWDLPGKNTGVVWHTLLHGIFLTQASNLCLLHLLYWQTGSLPLVPPGNTLLQFTSVQSLSRVRLFATP